MKQFLKKIDMVIGDLSTIFGITFFLNFETVLSYDGFNGFFRGEFISTFVVGVCIYILIKSFGVKKVFPSFKRN